MGKWFIQNCNNGMLSIVPHPLRNPACCFPCLKCKCRSVIFTISLVNIFCRSGVCSSWCILCPLSCVQNKEIYLFHRPTENDLASSFFNFFLNSSVVSPSSKGLNFFTPLSSLSTYSFITPGTSIYSLPFCFPSSPSE